MSCGHGCGPWYPWPSRVWYGQRVREPDWYEDDTEDVPTGRRRTRRDRAADPDVSTASLETRLEELHDELRRVKAVLEERRRPAGETPTR